MFLSGHASHRQFSDIKALSRPKGINKATTTKNTRFPSCYAEVRRTTPPIVSGYSARKAIVRQSTFTLQPPQLAQSLARILKAVKDAVREKGASSAISLISSWGIGWKSGIELPNKSYLLIGCNCLPSLAATEEIITS